MSGLLLKLSPKTASLSVGGTGKPDLEPCDIAAALSMLNLDEFETMYIRARVLDAEPWGMGTTLEIMGWMRAMDIAIANKWDMPKGKELIRALMFQVMDRRIRAKSAKCGACRGTGLKKLDSGKLVPCHSCDGMMEDASGIHIGNGVRKVSDREYARRLGMDKNTFKVKWKPRMLVLKRSLIEIERLAANIAGAVYDDEV